MYNDLCLDVLTGHTLFVINCEKILTNSVPTWINFCLLFTPLLMYHNYEKLPKSIKIGQVNSKSGIILNKPSKNSQNRQNFLQIGKFRQSGHTALRTHSFVPQMTHQKLAQICIKKGSIVGQWLWRSCPRNQSTWVRIQSSTFIKHLCTKR